MQIKEYTYRKPDYLNSNDLKNITSIAIHHTSNNNDINVNTDYHMDHNGWTWNGYGYVVEDGVPYKVRGYEYQNAAVKGYNDKVVSIAVKGNYNTSIPSQKDIEAVQYIIDHVKSKVPSINNIHGHNFWNDTTCPGKLFPTKTLKVNKVEYVTKQELEEVKAELNKTTELMKRMQRSYEKDIRFIENHLSIRIR